MKKTKTLVVHLDKSPLCKCGYYPISKGYGACERCYEKGVKAKAQLIVWGVAAVGAWYGAHRPSTRVK